MHHNHRHHNLHYNSPHHHTSLPLQVKVHDRDGSTKKKTSDESLGKVVTVARAQTHMHPQHNPQRSHTPCATTLESQPPIKHPHTNHNPTRDASPTRHLQTHTRCFCRLSSTLTTSCTPLTCASCSRTGESCSESCSESHAAHLFIYICLYIICNTFICMRAATRPQRDAARSKHGSVIVTAEPMSGIRIHDLTFDVSCKELQKKDVMGSSDP